MSAPATTVDVHAARLGALGVPTGAEYAEPSLGLPKSTRAPGDLGDGGAGADTHKTTELRPIAKMGPALHQQPDPVAHKERPLMSNDDTTSACWRQHVFSRAPIEQGAATPSPTATSSSSEPDVPRDPGQGARQARNERGQI